MFYVTMLSCLNYEIKMGIVHTKICTNENYPLYGNYIGITTAVATCSGGKCVLC